MAHRRKTRTEQLVDAEVAVHQERLRSSPALMPYLHRKVNELSRPELSPQISNGEIVPAKDDSNGNWQLRNTLQDAETPNVDASYARTDLLQRAGVLEMGIDAAMTIEARNSFEKMLAHQMAALHYNAMTLMAEANSKTAFNQNAEIVAMKKINLAARLMDTYQRGMETLTKVRNAGRQTITVVNKQVHVSGGQAVIADNMTTGGTGGGGGA